MVVVIEEEGVEFHDLPEGCIENVLSFTTPHDMMLPDSLWLHQL